MALCGTCRALELEYQPSPQDEDGDCPNKWYAPPPRIDIDLDVTIYCLGSWSQITQSAQDGCKSCQFFSDCVRERDLQFNNARMVLYLEHDYQHALQWDLTGTLPSWLPDAMAGQIDSDLALQESTHRGWKINTRLHLNKEQASDVLMYPTRDRSIRIFGQPIVLELCRSLASHITLGARPLESDLFCSTIIEPDPSSEPCTDLIRFWIERCSEHTRCRSQESVVLPKRLISINPDGKVRLRQSLPGERGQYLTLTHCWGKTPTAVLKLENIDQLSQDIEVGNLPQNFQDAIKITRKLGIRYLWIDAVCIIQNSPDDWAEQAPQMANIYGDSLLTLSALEAPNSSSGFLGLRPHSSPPMGIQRDRYLRNYPKAFLDVLDNSVLNSRGWCAQERLMAPRVLHFTREQIVWECAEGCYTEGMPSCPLLGGTAFGDTSLQEIADSTFQSSPTTVGVSNAEICRRLYVWGRCVLEYSKRYLTYPSDKLPATAGLAQRIDNAALGRYFAGIWERNLFQGLLWHRAYQAVVASSDQKEPLLSLAEPYRAPSWSWAAYDGHVHLPADPPDLQEKEDQKWKAWHRNYSPRLVEYHMKLKSPAQPYMEVLEGSHLIIEGHCRYVLPASPETRTIPGEIAEMFVMSDTSYGYSAFVPFQYSDKKVFPEDRFVDKARLHLCVQMNAYDDGYGNLVVDLLVLEPTDRDETAWRRIGYSALKGSSRGWAFNMKDLDDIGWELKTLKLV